MFLRLTMAAVTLLCAFSLLEVPAPAQEPDQSTESSQWISYGAEADFSSHYVWRGIVLDNNPVFQPSGWVSASGFTLVAWRNIPLTNSPETANLRVTDLELAYSHDWKKLTVEGGLDAYLNPQVAGVRDPNTMELFVRASYPIGVIRVFTEHAFDVVSHSGAYFGEAGVKYERQLTKEAAMELSLRSGWASSQFNSVYIGLNKPAFNFIGATAHFTYHLKPYLYFQPHVEFSRIVDSGLRAQLPWPTATSFGLAIGLEF